MPVNALARKNNGDISVTARCCLGISGALSFVLRERFFTASVPRLGKAVMHGSSGILRRPVIATSYVEHGCSDCIVSACRNDPLAPESSCSSSSTIWCRRCSESRC
jgi:hypothetical protein